MLDSMHDLKMILVCALFARKHAQIALTLALGATTGALVLAVTVTSFDALATGGVKVGVCTSNLSPCGSSQKEPGKKLRHVRTLMLVARIFQTEDLLTLTLKFSYHVLPGDINLG